MNVCVQPQPGQSLSSACSELAAQLYSLIQVVNVTKPVLVPRRELNLCCQGGTLLPEWQSDIAVAAAEAPKAQRLAFLLACGQKWVTAATTVLAFCQSDCLSALRSALLWPWLSSVVIACLLCTALLLCHGCSQQGVSVLHKKSPLQVQAADTSCYPAKSGCKDDSGNGHPTSAAL